MIRSLVYQLLHQQCAIKLVRCSVNKKQPMKVKKSGPVVQSIVGLKSLVNNVLSIPVDIKSSLQVFFAKQKCSEELLQNSSYFLAYMAVSVYI